MDVREKLLNLIIAAKKDAPETGSFTEWLTDYLLANGVTIQKWIPVSERLPEDGRYVPVIVSGRVGNVRLDRAVELAEFSMDEGWILEMWPDWENPTVTHWMPLPEPPKEV